MDSSLFEKGFSPICICEHDYDFLTQEETKLLLPYLERELNALRVEAAGLSETRNIFLQACPYLELEEVPGEIKFKNRTRISLFFRFYFPFIRNCGYWF